MPLEGNAEGLCRLAIPGRGAEKCVPAPLNTPLLLASEEDVLIAPRFQIFAPGNAERNGRHSPKILIGPFLPGRQRFARVRRACGYSGRK